MSGNTAVQRKTVRDVVGYLALATLALSFVALVETVFVSALVPYASTHGLGLASLWLNLFAYHALFMVPLAFGCAWLEPYAVSLPLPRTAHLVAGFVYLWQCTRVMRWLDAWLDNLRPDFGEALAEIEKAWTIAVLVIGLAFALALARALDWLIARVPRLELPRAVLGVLCLVLGLQAVWLAYQGLSPIHLGRAAIGPALAFDVLALLAARFLCGLPTAHASRRAGALALGVLTLLGLTAADQAQTRFLVHNHASLAGVYAARLRDALDFDGDGSSPTWALGNDCAPFDGRVSPLEREVPGDGIDQDCSGGDAKAARSPTAPRRKLCTTLSDGLSVLLITIDALRADAVNPATTPNLLELARRSIQFGQAYAAGSMTVNATAAMVTGKALADLTHNPFSTPRFSMPRPIGLVMRDAGFRTAVLEFNVVPDAIKAGFTDRDPGSRDLFEGVVLLNFTSATIADSLIAWIEKQSDARFFAWAHFADPHAPYRDPRSSFLEPGTETYLREVGYTDFHLGRLFQWLFDTGRAERTAVIVTADHGESLGEYGHEGHGVDGYQNTVHVPLLVYAPGCAAQRVDTPVSLVRTAATIAELARVPGFAGSLLEVPATPELVVSEVHSSDLVFDEKRFARAIVYGRHKLIHDVRGGGYVLFDLSSPEGEAHDLFAEDSAAREAMRTHYQRWLDRPVIQSKR